MSMATGRSLHIGLNKVDADAYGGWSGDLAACEFDAHDLREICAGRGFETTSLLTAEATSEAVLGALQEASQALVGGDLLVVTYSGHGGQMPDADGPQDEPDKLDETWVLYDRQVLDDELYAIWATFAPDVRIVVLSDSCHSGSVVKAQLDAAGGSGPIADALAGGRFMPWDDNVRDNAGRAALYDTIRTATPPEGREALQARVLLLSGCQDNQTSMDGDRNGAFTGTLREVWADGAFRGGYRTFHRQIRRRMPPWQSPNYMTVHDSKRAFGREQPFTI
jgi:hypothetical protein